MAIPPLEYNTLMVIFEDTAEMGGCSVYLRSNLVLLAIPPLEYSTLMVVF